VENLKNKACLSLILIFLLLGFVPLKGQGFVLKKDIYVAEDEVLDNVMTFGGDILVKGKINENVIAFGGTITIEGEVGEVVLGFGSEVTLKSSAIIKGDVVVLGGELHRESGVVIRGDTVYFNASEDVTEFLKEGLGGVIGISLIPFLLIIKLITLFIWFILAVIFAAVFPRQICLASAQIRKSFWPIIGTGLLSLIIFSGLVILSAFLCFVIIGIPILISLITIGIIIKIFGRVILFHFFGDSLARAFGSKQPSILLSVSLGFLLVGLISIIPILGSLFSFVLSIIGWGVVIRTRFGTVGNWFKKYSVTELS